MPTKRFLALPPDQQAHILRIAAEEFADHGYAGASTNRIIERAGTSKGAVYYWFEDKADLYRTVVLDGVRRFMAQSGTLQPVETAEAYWREVRRLLRDAMTFYDVDPVAPRLIRSLARDAAVAGPPRPGARAAVPVTLVEIRSVCRGMLEDVVRRGQDVGAITVDLPADLILTLLTGIIEGMDIWFAEHHEQLALAQRQALLDAIVDMLRRMSREDP